MPDRKETPTLLPSVSVLRQQGLRGPSLGTLDLSLPTLTPFTSPLSVSLESGPICFGVRAGLRIVKA
jgi:hypothetical protein